MMRVTVAAGAFVLVAATPLVEGTRGAHEGQREVVLYVSVLDGSSPAQGLLAGDFEVLEDGRPRPITRFAAGPAEFSGVLLVDVSGSMRMDAAELVRTARAFGGALHAGDRAWLGAFGPRVLFAPGFASTQSQLVDAARTLFQPDGPSPLWDAIDASMTLLADEPGRRVIIAVTDGRANGNRLSAPSVLARALGGGYIVYFVGPGDDVETPFAAASPLPGAVLQRFASATGGARVSLSPGRSGVGYALTQVVRELRHQYTIGFSPGELPGGSRQIEVRVKRSGVTARTRTEYHPASHQR